MKAHVGLKQAIQNIRKDSSMVVKAFIKRALLYTKEITLAKTETLTTGVLYLRMKNFKAGTDLHAPNARNAPR